MKHTAYLRTGFIACIFIFILCACCACAVHEETAEPAEAVQTAMAASPTKEPTPEPTATPEPTPEPTPTPVPVERQDLSGQCRFTSTQKTCKAGTLQDHKLNSNIILANHTKLTYSWDDSVAADAIYYFSYVRPESLTVTQLDGTGNTISEEVITMERMCGLIPLDAACRSVTLYNEGRYKLNSLQVFSKGDYLPSNTVYWVDDAEDSTVDLMLFSTHYDDELLMMGGVLPIYAGKEGRDCMLIYMKGGGEMDETRRFEGIQSTWECGVKREPHACYFTSNSLGGAVENNGAPGLEGDDLADVVALLRRYQPLVVVTHDINGEYGHESHIKTSTLVRRAVELASDPNSYPESAEQYGTWQVQKLYIHLYGERTLTLDIDTPIDSMGGRTAYEVAEDAFDYHKSQHYHWSLRSTSAKYPINQFGLYFTTVGDDTGINDMFEHTYREEN